MVRAFCGKQSRILHYSRLVQSNLAGLSAFGQLIASLVSLTPHFRANFYEPTFPYQFFKYILIQIRHSAKVMQDRPILCLPTFFIKSASPSKSDIR